MDVDFESPWWLDNTVLAISQCSPVLPLFFPMQGVIFDRNLSTMAVGFPRYGPWQGEPWHVSCGPHSVTGPAEVTPIQGAQLLWTRAGRAGSNFGSGMNGLFCHGAIQFRFYHKIAALFSP